MLTKADIEQYFIAEKNTGMLLLIIAAAAVLFGIVCIAFLKSPFYKGAAWPLLVLGIVQAVAGYTLYARSDRLRIDTVYAYDMNPARLRTETLPAAEKATKREIIYVTLGYIMLAAGILIVWKNRASLADTGYSAATFGAGIGLALILQAILLSAACYPAYKRGKAYTAKLQEFTQGV
jgi:uncharacterized membrane protein HdeD (DUF308 family)